VPVGAGRPDHGGIGDPDGRHAMPGQGAGAAVEQAAEL
jgi:hypothetical protein